MQSLQSLQAEDECAAAPPGVCARGVPWICTSK